MVTIRHIRILGLFVCFTLISLPVIVVMLYVMESGSHSFTTSHTGWNHTISDARTPHIALDFGKSVDCSAVFMAEEKALQNAIAYDEQHPSVTNTDLTYINMTSNCQTFVNQRGYIMSPVNEEEATFPIAYSILSYKDAESTELLLRAIYRPQNVYCIHVDEKSDVNFKRGMASIVSCFPNVFLSSRSVDIQWSEWSLVEAELVCMKDLVEFPSWRYHINLAGQEFPLKTNLELVQMLKSFNGSNMMEATSKKKMRPYRYRYKFKMIKGVRRGLKTDIPIDVSVVKGSFLITVTRAFVEWVLSNKDARSLGRWLNDAFIPDELFFSTLNFNPHLGAPGAYRGLAETSSSYPYLNRFILWKSDDEPCHGMYVREVCIISPVDLHSLYHLPHMFFNKFNLGYHPSTYMCMEQLIRDRTIAEIETGNVRSSFDESYYKTFEFTWNHN